LPVDHYENFPVASWLLPGHLRAPIEAIYAFARGADDVADEGDASEAERLAGLRRYGEVLDAIDRGETPPAPFDRLACAMREHALPVSLFRDLLDAFAQDVTVKRYRDYASVLDYCRRSANPVGRLLLHLFHMTDATSLAQSDAVCTSLQLINFWQDVALDWQKARIYIPEEDLERFEVKEADIGARIADDKWTRLMAFECTRTRELLEGGRPLGRRLTGRMGLEIRATIAGGARILDKIDAASGDVFRKRPTLKPWDWLLIGVQSI
jgi:squalene synthase HpnC